MYRPKAYAVDDAGVLHAAIRERRFATIAATIDGRVQFAYAPVVVDNGKSALGRARFHLAKANPLAGLNDAPVRLSFLGPDAYISPDWYETHALVPTWNYVAVEASGTARRLDRENLRELLVDLSRAEEEKLAPKMPWALDKVPEDRLGMLLNAIVGFALELDTLEGKYKLSQDKRDTDVAGAIAGLEARGDPASLAIAREMRWTRKHGTVD